MRMFMTFMCMPFTTLIVGVSFRDFHIGIAVSILLSFLTYMFWDEFFDKKKTETCANK